MRKVIGIGETILDIIFADGREQNVQPLFGIVFIEDVFRVAVFVQESQGYGRFAIREHIDVIRRDMIVTHELQDDVSNMVVARFADETYIDSHAS